MDRSHVCVEKIYFPYSIKEPYIYALFYSQTNPYIYVETVQKKNEKGTFENIISFGKYEFYKNLNLEENHNNIYIVELDSDWNIDEERWDKIDFQKYTVLRFRK